MAQVTEMTPVRVDRPDTRTGAREARVTGLATQGQVVAHLGAPPTTATVAHRAVPLRIFRLASAKGRKIVPTMRHVSRVCASRRVAKISRASRKLSERSSPSAVSAGMAPATLPLS
jgi:hypothetical protein